MIETERLYLREMTDEDFEALRQVLGDPEIMCHYPYSFDEERIRNWIHRNRERYRVFGFGLWAVELKETNRFIGDCGITMQNIDGKMLPEIGYHIHKSHWRQGYAKEAASAVRDWLFRNTDFESVYSYMTHTNLASYSTAASIGMKKSKEYFDTKGVLHDVYALTRSEWQAFCEQSIQTSINLDI